MTSASRRAPAGALHGVVHDFETGFVLPGGTDTEHLPPAPARAAHSATPTPITFQVEGGRGTLRIGQDAEAVMEPYRGPTGELTTLNESIFSTIPGSPAYVAKASTYRVKNAALGFDINLKDHNAIQGSFRFEG